MYIKKPVNIAGVNPPKGIVTQERTYGKRRLSEPEPQRPKRIAVHGESPTMVKQERRENSPPKQILQGNNPQTAFSYRNSMYHRGRWYTITNDEQKCKAIETMKTVMDPKEHCNKCSNSFHNRTSLSEHRCIKLTSRNYTCVYCDLSCDSLTELGKHMEDHVNERPYRCGYCSCSFNNGAALNQHVRIHAREYSTKQVVLNHGIDKSGV